MCQAILIFFLRVSPTWPFSNALVAWKLQKSLFIAPLSELEKKHPPKCRHCAEKIHHGDRSALFAARLLGAAALGRRGLECYFPVYDLTKVHCHRQVFSQTDLGGNDRDECVGL